MFSRSTMLTAALLSTALAAHASPMSGTYAVTVHEGLTQGVGFDTAAGDPFSGANTASATFMYTGAINFDNTAAQNAGGSGDLNSSFGFTSSSISGYNGSGTVVDGSTTVANYKNKAQFLASSGSAGGYVYGSYYTFDLGNLSAGTILTITHDDGISLFQGATRLGSSVSGPTSQTTDVINLTSSGDTILRYARENGTPSVLEVSSTAVTPEPNSIALLGTGLLGIAGMLRKRIA